jgi:hypothetical protein
MMEQALKVRLRVLCLAAWQRMRLMEALWVVLNYVYGGTVGELLRAASVPEQSMALRFLVSASPRCLIFQAKVLRLCACLFLEKAATSPDVHAFQGQSKKSSTDAQLDLRVSKGCLFFCA